MKDKFIDKLAVYFGEKAPKLPKGFKDFLVTIAPYLNLVGILIMISSLFALLGLGYLGVGLNQLFYGLNPVTFWISLGLSIVVLILYVMAVPGLFKKTESGWNYIFYAVLVAGVQNLLSMNLIGLVIGLLLSFYVLFQIKSYYFKSDSFIGLSGETK